MKRPHPLFILLMIVGLSCCGFFKIIVDNTPAIKLTELGMSLSIVLVPLIAVALISNRIFEITTQSRISVYELIYNSFMLFIILTLHWIVRIDVLQPEMMKYSDYQLGQIILRRSYEVSLLIIFLSGAIHKKIYRTKEYSTTS